jgi:CoA:oxalate CoA-transferase
MTAAGPLDGILVLDLTRVLAGPYCTMLLSDLGARVIKVERPGTGDDSRHIGPFIGDESAYFISLNRGKQSIALDLRRRSRSEAEPKQSDATADRGLFERLLERADVLVENFRPGAMERLGYGWESLHRRYPRLIYAAASGFGRTGPYARRPAYDMVVQGMGGIMSLTGTPDGPPTRVGSSIGDITAGLFTAVGVNAALFERSRTGRGQLIDVAMLDCQVAILENAIARYRATGDVPGPLGARHPSITPFGAFRTRDGHVIVAAGNDGLFATLCRTLERLDLLERDEFTSNDARTRNHDALQHELEATLAERSTADWLERLTAAEIPCGPINDIAQLLADPQVRARNMLVQVARQAGEPIEIAGNPLKLSGAEDPTTRPAAPELDGDRAQLVREFGLESAATASDNSEES